MNALIQVVYACPVTLGEKVLLLPVVSGGWVNHPLPLFPAADRTAPVDPRLFRAFDGVVDTLALAVPLVLELVSTRTDLNFSGHANMSFRMWAYRPTTDIE